MPKAELFKAPVRNKEDNFPKIIVARVGEPLNFLIPS